MTDWKFADGTRRAVFRINESGFHESTSIDREDVQAWIAAGNTVLEPDPPAPPSKDEADAVAALAYPKLQALLDMSPAQVDAWVEVNVTNLATVKDALKTLAIGFSVLGRRIRRT